MKNGKNGLMSYEQLHELLQMTALQTAQNAKDLAKTKIEFDREIKISRQERKRDRQEHNREMKEIRAGIKNLIKRIAV